MNIERILEHLSRLIASDSQNPPRAITPNAPMFDYVRSILAKSFSIEMFDHGDGHVTLFARRGRPQVLFNCHLDTVPVGDGWTVPPLELSVHDGRAWGRGACDIKGAAAALLAVAEATDAPMALLLTSDEEGAGGCCVREFLATEVSADFGQAVVCEPTVNRAVLSHRGFLSVLGHFNGTAGHSSQFRALEDSAVHAAGRWIAAAVEYCAQEADAGRHTCFNVGRISGGLKSNVIADGCDLHYSARLAPGQDNQTLLDAISGLAGADAGAEWKVPFSGPPLPARGRTMETARAFAEGHALGIIEKVDFWTEASLFSAAGMDAIVLGPGHIEQAHTVDEWVALDQLETAAGQYHAIVEAATATMDTSRQESTS
ncbi:MAG: acetylornithine deacetylase [Wenzhouxiangellaceae bacterium]